MNPTIRTPTEGRTIAVVGRLAATAAFAIAKAIG